MAFGLDLDFLTSQDAVGQVLTLTLFAGLMIPLGGLVARYESFENEHLQVDLRHGMVAVGAGALLSAVALVLVPEGLHALHPVWAFFWFAMGTLFFVQLDRLIERMGGSAANVVATVMDFIPESLALGAAFAIGSGSGAVLALLIAVQNLPEGYASYHELMDNGDIDPRKVNGILSSLVILGPISGMIGFFFIGNNAALLGAIAMFASGGILFAVFHDLAPASLRNCHYAPTLGASVGFSLGMIGQAVLG